MARIALLVVAIATIAGCELLSRPSVEPEGELVTYQTRGGECPAGECRFSMRILSDGRVVRSDGLQQTLDPATLDRLTSAIDAADWDAILAVPFEGECPVNVDGQEVVYTFHVAPDPIVVASCTTLVDPAQEPFRTVESILASGR